MPQYDSKNPFERIKFRGAEHKYFVVDFGYPRFNEVDAYKVMWNGHYVNYFETSRFYYGKYMNIGTSLFEEYGFQVPIYSYNVQMRNVVTQDERIRVGVRPVSFKKGLLDLFHVLMVDKEIKAVGNIVHAVIEKDTRSIPFPIPNIVTDIVERVFQPFVEEMEISSSKHKSEEAHS